MTNAARFLIDNPLMVARPDGSVTSDTPVLLPMMAPRLQGDFDPSGSVKVALWAAGTLATLTFSPFAGPFIYGPNSVSGTRGAVAVAQSVPALVIREARIRRLLAAPRASWWHDGASVPAPVLERLGERRVLTLGWGVVIVEPRGHDIVVAVGTDRAEAEAALAITIEQIVLEAAAYAARCDRLPEADPLLRSMVIQGTHAALSSIRKDQHGAFAGLAAGQAYSAPARTYYRDGYWTLQPLLTLAPEAVRGELKLLAKGVQPDGEAPSGVILSGPAQAAAWDYFRRNDKRYSEEHFREGDWWSDHFDSPLFFVLILAEYVRATGDMDTAREHWTIVQAVHDRYQRAAGDDGLPRKPHHDRDWADNVYRGGLVAYDLGLWVGALDGIAELGKVIEPSRADRATAEAKAARQTIDPALWRDDAGNYADFINPDGFVEDHLTIDSFTLLRFSAVPEAKAKALLDKAEAQLEARNNDTQPYGDWGTLCAFPPFKRARDIRSKTAFAYRYHNGSDWPYLDGLYAEERLRRGLGGARYALTRWWAACLANGWAGAVEYYSPPFGRGSLLQGWSGLPAHVAVLYRDQLAGEVDKPNSRAAALGSALGG
jgi:hypothetical protein